MFAPSAKEPGFFFNFFFRDREDLSLLPSALRREENTEEGIHLFSPITHFSSSPIPLPDWLLCSLTACLDVWLPLSLDSRWRSTHTVHERRRGWSGARRSGCSGFGKSDLSLRFLPLSVFTGLLNESRGPLSRSLSPPPLSLSPALTTDSHCWLHPWLYLPGWWMGLDLF